MTIRTIRGANIYNRVTPPGFPIVLGRRAIQGVAPVNTVAPAVTGNPQSGSTLICDGGTWTGLDALAFRWYRNNTPMIGEQNSTLVLVSPYIGDTVLCQVTGSNAHGTTTVYSNEIEVLP